MKTLKKGEKMRKKVGFGDWMVTVFSIPKTKEQRMLWPSENEICPKCGEPFGSYKMVRDLIDGKRVVVHKKCSDGSYLKH